MVLTFNGLGDEMKKRNLLLLTNRYPYLPGEEFLHTEFPYLNEEFENIYIVTTNALIKKENKRSIDQRVKVFHSFEKQNSKVDLVKKLFGHKEGLSWLFKDLKDAVTSPKRSLKLLNWVAIAVQVHKTLKKVVLDEQLRNEDTIIYSYWQSPGALAAVMLKKEYGFQTVCRAHGGDVYAERHNPDYLPLQEEVIQRLDRLFVISEDGKKYLSSKYPSVKSQLAVRRLGTRDPEAQGSPSEDGVLRLVSCSYVVPVKRLGLLIETLKLCRQKIEWTHIGDGPLFEEIKSKSKELPENVSARFLGNKKNHEIYEYYAGNQVDLFVNVSSTEGIPVSIMEVFSFGIPALATDVGGTRELVNPSTGRLLNKDIEPRELALIIDEMAQLSKEEREELGKEALKKWQEDYNAEQNFTSFAKELSE
jgi:glycosyltransferase involved in cell wall biosynthesis